MNIAEGFKKQTDKILRQQKVTSDAGVTIVATPTGDHVMSNPPNDLALHKASGDHDSRYARVFTDLNDAPNSYEGNAEKIIAVNIAGDALEFIDAPTGGGGGSATWDYGLITTAAGTEFDEDWGGIA